jgi:UDPglucose 6-dehydrogenase
MRLIAAWNDTDLENYRFTSLDWPKWLQKQEGFFFSTDVDAAIEAADMILLLLILLLRLTEEKRNGRFDLKFVELCAEQIARVLLPIRVLSRNRRCLFVLLKLCRPSWTVQEWHFILILSNPEFLAEGTAIEDLFNADRGADWWKQTESGESDQTLVDVYAHWLTPNKY